MAAFAPCYPKSTSSLRSGRTQDFGFAKIVKRVNGRLAQPGGIHKSKKSPAKLFSFPLGFMPFR